MLKIDNKVLKINGGWLNVVASPEPLQPYTLRLKFTEGVSPAATPMISRGTLVQVSSSPNIWDLTYENSDWTYLLYSQVELLEVIDVNISGVTNMQNIFYGCTSLTSVPLFDTSNITNMIGMFNGCTSLISVPLFDTSKVTSMGTMFNDCTSLTSVPLFDTSNVTSMGSMFYNCSSLTSVPLFDTSNVNSMNYMFQNCSNVQSGALALYQQASSQTNVPSHTNTFRDCGSNTSTGAAELAQIPSDWK